MRKNINKATTISFNLPALVLNLLKNIFERSKIPFDRLRASAGENLLLIIFFSLLVAPAHAEHTIHASFSWHQTDNKDSHHHIPNSDFSHDPSCNNDRAISHKHQFKHYKVHELKQYFTSHGYTENQILNQRCLYMSDEFVKFAQTFSGYKNTIQQLHTELKHLNGFQQFWYKFKGTYCRGLQERIHYLYSQLKNLKNEIPTRTEPIWRDHSLEKFQSQLPEYKELQATYQTHAPSLSHAINNRLTTYNHITSTDYALQYASKSYNLNNNVKQLLSKYNHDTARFTQCHGNPLQHIIHQESLDLLNRIDHLSPNSVLYDHQEALVDFTVAIVDYNHEGITDKATIIADFCWTLLDCGQAVAEGAAIGVYSAVTDILNNPIETTIAVIASKPLLAYQLSKVLYNVADIGVTALTSIDKAKDKWNKYAEPLNNIIDAISKKEMSVRDAIKGSTSFVVGLVAQSKLLGGLGKFCNTIQRKATRFVQNNISSFTIQQYLSTPEGYLLRSVAKTSCSASCPNQYEHLKQWLRIKEFTSVIKTTRHGIERLIERDFTPKDVELVMKHPSFVKMQKDGALAYVKQIGEKFNIIIFNEHTEEVVTALKNTTQKKLNQMGKNYGWR
jgi:hypothetical protein